MGGDGTCQEESEEALAMAQLGDSTVANDNKNKRDLEKEAKKMAFLGQHSGGQGTHP